MRRTNSSRPYRAPLAALSTLVVALSGTAACGSGSDAQNQDGNSVTIGVGGQPLLAYLPTTLAAQLGCYDKNGIDADLQDLQSGSKALQAMLGGSTDVTSGYYEHTAQMAAKGQEVRAFVNMLRYPALVLAVAPDSTGEIDSIADLDGKTVGVTAPGSSTDFFLKHLLTKAGLSQDAASVQAIGADATAVAAMEKGQVDAAVMADPALSQLEERAGELAILADTRTEEGVKEAYGTTTYPAAVLYAKQSWIDENQDTTAALAASITCALDFIHENSPEDIAAEMPPKFAGENPDLYVKAIAKLKEAYNPSGDITEDGAKAVRDVLAAMDPAIAGADVDVAQTYTNEFLQK